jgi:dihydroorotate dehydrogenase (NAD+) catalytic subunit
MANKNTITTEFLGLDLASPIVLLSGCVGFGDEYTRLEGFSNADIGGAVLKGTTLEPRLGNVPHRVYETPSGMLNSIGLQNPGAHEVVENILPSLEPFETHFIANVSGSTVDEYIEVCRIFDQSNISAIELNISCPNVKKGGMEFGNDPEMSAQVVEACKAATSKPIITKLSPNQADIKESARKCIDAGSDALSVINTITGMAIDIESKRPVLGNTSGGLSGPAIKPIALQKVMQVYEVAGPQNIPIMGQGGISSVEDALEFIIAGASTIGIGTALFIDPLICNKINVGLEKYLNDHGLDDLESLVGSLIKD